MGATEGVLGSCVKLSDQIPAPLSHKFSWETSQSRRPETSRNCSCLGLGSLPAPQGAGSGDEACAGQQTVCFLLPILPHLQLLLTFRGDKLPSSALSRDHCTSRASSESGLHGSAGGHSRGYQAGAGLPGSTF
jgi:hypothetical protein